MTLWNRKSSPDGLSAYVTPAIRWANEKNKTLKSKLEINGSLRPGGLSTDSSRKENICSIDGILSIKPLRATSKL